MGLAEAVNAGSRARSLMVRMDDVFYTGIRLRSMSRERKVGLLDLAQLRWNGREGEQYLDSETLEPDSGPALRLTEENSTEHCVEGRSQSRQA